MKGVRKVGQHKYNPTAIAAKKGEIKPRKKLTRSEQKKSKRLRKSVLFLKKVILLSQMAKSAFLFMMQTAKMILQLLIRKNSRKSWLMQASLLQSTLMVFL